MKMEYVHQELGKDVNALAGYYTPMNELRLEHDGKEVLCITGLGVIESSCCGTGGCAYAIVPGYIVNWKFKENEAGLPVSEVESVADKEARREISAILQERECVGNQNVEFW
ncbi:MAG: hypothetical protein KAS54_01525 [Dehalococcoidia bacterium]|nr:hypothetical protein [Dehalococcoidia bacterium]